MVCLVSYGLVGYDLVWSSCLVLVFLVCSGLACSCLCQPDKFRSGLVWSSWYHLVSSEFVWSVLLCSSLVCLLWFALVCSWLFFCRLISCHWLGFLSLAWFLQIESCFVLVWSTLLYSRLVCSGILGLVFFTSGCLVCCARAGLVGQHSCGIEFSCLSHVLGVVKAARQARPKTTRLARSCSKGCSTIDLVAVKLLSSW